MNVPLYRITKLDDIRIDGNYLIIDSQSYLMIDKFKVSMARLLKTNINRVVIYTVSNIAIAIIDATKSIITPNDILNIKNQLSNVYYYKALAGHSDLAILEPQEIQILDNTCKIGVWATISHIGSQMVSLYPIVSFDECAMILSDKNFNNKIRIDNSLNILNQIKSASKYIHTSIKDWVVQRYNQTKQVSASLEECVIASKFTDHKISLNLDEILVAHGIASYADAWAMYRKQANTPYSRYDLMKMIYNTDIEQFKKLTEIGRLFTNFGDLEFRPAWLSWRKNESI